MKPAEPMDLPPDSPFASPLIIVVDDDEDTRLNLRDILELDGYRVEVAGTARELLSRKSWDDVALVLLDRKLPDGTPREVLPRIREQAAHVAVVVVTGYADIEGAISALQVGAADYILKPVNPDALRASVRRVLERLRSEREISRLNEVLSRNEERYRSLFENTLDGLVILDHQGRIVSANPAACSGLGFAIGSLDGQRLDSITISAEGGQRPASRSDFFRGGKGILERTFVLSDGALVTMDCRAVEDFTPGLDLISLRDTTARKQAEERALLAQRLAAIGETMAALVHESRNALQRGKASLEMLRLEVEDRPEALQFVARAERAQDDLHQLFEEVRQWAAPLQLRRQTCNLRELWKEIWYLVGQAHPARSARLVEDVSCEPVCSADSFAMGQVFRNVFENAIEVSPAGAAVTIRCATQSGGNGEQIVITISDQGPGLSVEQQRRIFEPFFTTKAKGTGLGMAIAQRIVYSHGGTIQANSGPGAQIEIRLPRGEV